MFEAHLQVEIYYNLLLLLVLMTAVSIFLLPKVYKSYVPFNSLKIVFLLFFSVLFIGYREWWAEDVFIDSIRYGYQYHIIKWTDLSEAKDIAYSLFQLICKSCGFTTSQFFVICAIVYVYPLYILSKRMSDKYSSLFFLVCISSMSFYSYGVNGIRNGLATSLMLLAFSFPKMSLKQLFYLILSIGFHLSVVLPIICYLIIPWIKKKRYYTFIWLLAIPLSFFLFGAISYIIENIAFLDKRAGSYMSGQVSGDIFNKTGFRYDFLIYSCLPIGMRMCFYKPNITTDSLYNKLFYTYVLTNAVWVLVNQVPFSNRFAYLSWCIMPFISLYPMLKWKSRYRSLFLALFVICYFIFTYLLNVV